MKNRFYLTIGSSLIILLSSQALVAVEIPVGTSQTIPLSVTLSSVPLGSSFTVTSTGSGTLNPVPNTDQQVGTASLSIPGATPGSVCTLKINALNHENTPISTFSLTKAGDTNKVGYSIRLGGTYTNASTTGNSLTGYSGTGVSAGTLTAPGSVRAEYNNASGGTCAINATSISVRLNQVTFSGTGDYIGKLELVGTYDAAP